MNNLIFGGPCPCRVVGDFLGGLKKSPSPPLQWSILHFTASFVCSGMGRHKPIPRCPRLLERAELGSVASAGEELQADGRASDAGTDSSCDLPSGVPPQHLRSPDVSPAFVARWEWGFRVSVSLAVYRHCLEVGWCARGEHPGCCPPPWILSSLCPLPSDGL